MHRTIAYLGLNPKATLAETKAAMQDNTISAIGAAGAQVNTITPAMAFNWSTAQTKGTGALAAIAADTEKAVAAPAAKVASFTDQTTTVTNDATAITNTATAIATDATTFIGTIEEDFVAVKTKFTVGA